jgi:hypothetical protein
MYIQILWTLRAGEGEDTLTYFTPVPTSTRNVWSKHLTIVPHSPWEPLTRSTEKLISFRKRVYFIRRSLNIRRIWQNKIHPSAFLKLIWRFTLWGGWVLYSTWRMVGKTGNRICGIFYILCVFVDIHIPWFVLRLI